MVADESTSGENISLVQLHRNVRKSPEKTSGRKRPRLNDINVVPPGDADGATASAVAAAVQPMTQPASAPDDDDRCGVCGCTDAPVDKAMKTKQMQWV